MHKYIFHIHLSYVDTNWKNIYISHEQDSYQILIKISDIAIENKVQFLVFKPHLWFPTFLWSSLLGAYGLKTGFHLLFSTTM